MCFDKTGTLTHDGLDLKGVRPAHTAQFGDLVEHAATLPRQLVEALACCQSLVAFESQLIGDALVWYCLAHGHFVLLLLSAVGID